MPIDINTGFVASTTNQLISADIFTVFAYTFLSAIMVGLTIGIFTRATYWLWWK